MLVLHLGKRGEPTGILRGDRPFVSHFRGVGSLVNPEAELGIPEKIGSRVKRVKK
jgi:hypothetical protein